jgi:hypothetical protein
MAYGTINADVIQSSVTGVSLGAGNATVFKNRIINGDMRIDQRNAGASVATTTAAVGTFTIDRWGYLVSVASKFTVQQNAGSVTLPAGFINYLGATSSAATSLAAGDYYLLYQPIEGLNMADLGWGTVNAKTITISFQVYSSLTGTFGGALRNSAANRSYPFSYSISTANTWTSISVTIAGDTSGTWLTTNGVGVYIDWSLGTGTTYSGTAGAWAATNYLSATGATSVVGTSGATFYITGVQLEVGSSATGFEYNDYGRQLIQCQRYYEKSYNQGTKPGTASTLANLIFIALGYLSVGTNVGGSFSFKVTKRTDATVTIYSPGTGAAGYARNGGSGDVAATLFAVGDTGGSAYVGASAGGVDFSIQYVATAEL